MKKLFWCFIFNIISISLFSQVGHDTCNVVVNHFDSTEQKNTVNNFLTMYGKCSYLDKWLSKYQYNQEVKEYLLMVIELIIKDPEYVLERFVEFYDQKSDNPFLLMSNDVEIKTKE